VALGRGVALAEAGAGIDGVIEGVATAQAAVALAARHGVDMPISAAVAEIVERGADIGVAIAALLTRPLKSEAD
jgi:glycerol-3-phosphate dehydrogenase (NAD(P)+)